MYTEVSPIPPVSSYTFPCRNKISICQRRFLIQKSTLWVELLFSQLIMKFCFHLWYNFDSHSISAKLSSSIDIQARTTKFYEDPDQKVLSKIQQYLWSIVSVYLTVIDALCLSYTHIYVMVSLNQGHSSKVKVRVLWVCTWMWDILYHILVSSTGRGFHTDNFLHFFDLL